MQSAGGNGTGFESSGGASSSHANQFHSFLQPPAASSASSSAASSGNKASEGDGDLPKSLPSYAPSSSSQATPVLPFGYDMLGRGPPSIKPNTGGPGALFGASAPNRGNGRNAGGEGKSARGDSSQRSPSTGMSTMSFQDSAQMYASAGAGVNAGGVPLALKIGRQEGIAGISAAQFAASTGGLTMDTALLARVSGTDPSLMGTEEIKQIMRTPDLLSIYQKLQEEDDRRQRRLERNRASARVRREKKKGMVETYEAEVSKLENSLNLLKSHNFGNGQAQELQSALEYSSGEHLRHAMMSKEAKMELMSRILGQHSRNTDALRRANFENQVLIEAATNDSDLSHSLRTQLGLTNEQCRRLASLSTYASDEARKLDAIRKCFSVLQAHDWLYFPGTETMLQQTRNTMTAHQFQRFLSWTTHNRDTIDDLQVIPSSAPPASEQSLEFYFNED